MPLILSYLIQSSRLTKEGPSPKTFCLIELFLSTCIYARPSSNILRIASTLLNGTRWNGRWAIIVTVLWFNARLWWIEAGAGWISDVAMDCGFGNGTLWTGWFGVFLFCLFVITTCADVAWARWSTQCIFTDKFGLDVCSYPHFYGHLLSYASNPGNQKDIYMHSHFFSLFLYALSAG